MTGAAALRRGGVEDISHIMATERRPGYDLMVGRWTEAALLAGTGSSQTRCWREVDSNFPYAVR